MTLKTFDQVEQELAEHFGFTPRMSIDIDGEVFEIPNPGLLDDDQQERWEELQFELESCDRDDNGELLQPHRRDGKLIKPAYNARLAIALWGEDRYAKYRAGGGTSSNIAMQWAKMAREMADDE